MIWLPDAKCIQPKSVSESFWKRRARWAAMRQNSAWWLAFFLPLLLGVSLLCACFVLVWRQHNWDLLPVWSGYAILVFASAVFAWWRAAGKWRNSADGLVQLDIAMRLKNRLTSAESGVGQWPAKPLEGTRDGYRWDLKRLLFPPVGASALMLFAVMIPIPESSARRSRPTEKPPGLVQVEQWKDELKKSDVFDQQAVKNLEEQLATLQDQPAGDWYKHSSLEAGETLRQETESALREMEKSMEEAVDALAGLEKMGDGLSENELNTLKKSLGQTAQGLEGGKLPIQRELSDKLKKLSQTSSRQLSREQLQQMRDRLRQGQQTCGNCLGSQGKNPAKDILGNKPGNGGPGGGGPPAPLTEKNATNLGSKKTEGLPGDDLSQALPGEVVEISKSVPDAKPEAESGASGGEIATPGQGGEAVWKDTLLPKEQEVLQRFFR